jgi:lysophospholipase L1-like esterase
VRTRTWAAVGLSVVVLAACSGGGSSSDATSTTRAPRIVYVALGDSYSSGEGAPPYDAASGSCHRAAAGWVRGLDRDVTAIVSLDDRACSGAAGPQLAGPWTDRRLPAQIPSSPDPRVTLVTLTIGGNDIGFAGIVGTCFVLSCAGLPTTAGFLGGLHALGDTLTTRVYPALERAYPNARIVHVGYPRLTPKAGRPVKGCAWLTADEQVATEKIVTDLDRTIRVAAAGTGRVTYVDTTDALAGHELCSGSSWINAVRLGGKAQAHPTAAGQRALERSIARSLHLSIAQT